MRALEIPEEAEGVEEELDPNMSEMPGILKDDPLFELPLFPPRAPAKLPKTFDNPD